MEAFVGMPATFFHGLTFDINVMRNPVAPSAAIFAPLSLLASSALLNTAAAAAAEAGGPAPITTREFPWRRGDRKRPLDSGGAKGRPRRRLDAGDDVCAVCLEPLHRQVGLLPCQHRLHHACLWGILPLPALGASAMLRCPLCRHALDRHDLRALGYEVSPGRLARLARDCQHFRALLAGSSPLAPRGGPEHRAATVERVLACSRLGPADGFLYNTCVLALDRMLHDRRQFAHTLAVQLASQHGDPPDTHDFVQMCLACHVEVLQHTGTVQEEPMDW